MKSEYKNIINNICKNIHTGLIDFSEPRSEASMPTQASSEFITNKQQGDWAEDVIFRAINQYSSNIVAVRYGKSDDLVAGDVGFDERMTMIPTWAMTLAIWIAKRLVNMSLRLLLVLKFDPVLF